MRDLGERPGDNLGLFIPRVYDEGGDDGFREWIEEVVDLGEKVFRGCFDERELVDGDLWQAYCGGILPVYYILDFILPELVSEFSEDFVLGTVAENLIWGAY